MKKQKKSLLYLGTGVLLLAGLGIGQNQLLDQSVGAASNDRMVPRFEVDPFWPQPLPNKWLLGRTIGVAADQQDHIYIVHRDTDDMFMSQELGLDLGRAECCTAAPPILEFDPSGNLVNAWGGPSPNGEYVWPESNHGIEIAPNGDVWIGGNGGADSHILVFTRTGEYIRTIGEPGNGPDSNSTSHFSRVAEIAIDASAGEAYIADGYGNRRVAVLDLASGAFKRYWGAYGNRPDDDADNTYTPGEPLPQQFRPPVHCAEPSIDDLVYVCDRGADRIQVFRVDGTFVKEALVSPATLSGSTWDIAFSKDPNQEFIYVADGSNMKVHVLDRQSLEVLYTFGDGGRQPGLFFGTHSIVTDSAGNIFTTETYEGKRVQKFVLRGMQPISQARPGAPWPASALIN
ncbi:MAG: 6-bladed beta-propeller [Pseudohongiellaceae bacterium]